ncbi:vitamin K-dependent protein C-like isoform X2 [Sitophilus oryzae]|nr:vitamin K-dependent protein C-like isoform X2 [Sitophilus oryzae]
MNHEFPWSSTIHAFRNNTAEEIQGTLLNNRYIVTAASRVLGLTPLDLKVTLGQYDKCFPDTSSMNVSVEKIVLHPDFSETTRAHDLALIKFNGQVNFERRIQPICLPTPSIRYLGQVATILGWPKKNNDQCVGRKIGLPVLDQKTCSSFSENNHLVTQDKQCAGVVGAKSLICSDDAGGPVMFRSYGGTYELLGILADYNDCEKPENLVYYTAINEHLTWITHNTRDACYCYKI